MEKEPKFESPEFISTEDISEQVYKNDPKPPSSPQNLPKKVDEDDGEGIEEDESDYRYKELEGAENDSPLKNPQGKAKVSSELCLEALELTFCRRKGLNFVISSTVVNGDFLSIFRKLGSGSG